MRITRRSLSLALTGALVLLGASACDRESGVLDSPAGQDAEQIVAEVVRAEWERLITPEALEDRVESALHSQPADTDAHALLSVYRGLRMQAGAASESEDARSGADEGVEYLLQAVVLTLGVDVAHEVVSGAAHVQSRAVEALEVLGASGGEAQAVRERLRGAEGHTAAAQGPLAAGDHVQALRHGTAAAVALRELAEDELAARWIRRAEKLFARASEMAGPNPEPPIAGWLAAAEQLLGQAHGSFEQGNYQAAISHAKASAQKSWQVMSALHEGPEPPSAEELAQRAIQAATDLLARAMEKAGPDPTPRVAEALEEARRLLDAARDAYADGEYRDAIRGARSSAGLSLRVIHHLSGGSRPGR